MSEDIESITRNTEEVITQEELEDLVLRAKDPEEPNPRTYVGYETSGPVHLGHLTSIEKLLDLQDVGFDPVVLFADKHTYLNNKGKEEWNKEERVQWIDEMTEYWQSTFESLDLEADFRRGSEFQEGQYIEDLLEFGTEITMNRSKKSMGEIANEESLTVAQAGFYPLMQALDIPHLDIDLAIGGTDQRGIHMKLARDKLPELGYDKPVILHYPLLTSLQGEGVRMSSSQPETMFPLHASEDTIMDRIKDAYFDPEDPIDQSPILQIANRFVFEKDKELNIVNPEYDVDEIYSNIDELYSDIRSGRLHPEDVKTSVGEEIVERLQPVRDYFKEEPEVLDPLEKVGYDKPEYIN